jgi:hypothetical protein
VEDPRQEHTNGPEVAGDEGEDHREGPPGYDLDEQSAIEELAEDDADD